MAISDAYADNAKYKAIIGKTTGDNDTEIDAQLIACSRYLDRALDVPTGFKKDAAAVARTYSPQECGIGDRDKPYLITGLLVDWMASAPTSVKVDEDRNGTFEITLATTDYEVLPRNATRGPESRPYREIRLLWSGSYTAFVPQSLVEVTTTFGWPAVPEAIAQAVCQIVAIYRLDSPRATTRMNEGFDAVIGMSPEAQRIVHQLSAVYGRRRVYA